ncbi:MAG: hypothetical protein R2752_09345 [Vicinamibacterales bacterium]
MRRTVGTFFTLAVVLALAQVSSAPTAQAAAAGQEPATLTGCLRSGNTATVFILRGATAPAAAPEAPDAGAQMPRDYLLVSVPENVELGPHLNHTIAVTGVAHGPGQGPAPPEGANTAEKALRRIAVQSIAEVAPNCNGR